MRDSLMKFNSVDFGIHLKKAASILLFVFHSATVIYLLANYIMKLHRYLIYVRMLIIHRRQSFQTIDICIFRHVQNKTPLRGILISKSMNKTYFIRCYLERFKCHSSEPCEQFLNINRFILKNGFINCSRNTACKSNTLEF